MARFLALGLAAAVLPACHDYKVSVANAGSNAAVVDLHYEIRHEDDEGNYDYTEHVYDTWTVAPLETGERSYGYWPLDVRITRVIDGFLLYTGSLEIDEFEEDHGTVEITVIP